MKKFQLLNEVWLYVNQAKIFNARDVAREFGLSERTVQRYIAELGELGLPIVSEAGRGGGYRVLPNKLLPPVSFTDDEVFSLFFAYQSLEQLQGLPFAADYSAVLRKLSSRMDERLRGELKRLDEYIAYLSPNHPLPVPWLKFLLEHAGSRSLLRITYRSGSARHSVIEGVPLGVYTSKGFWYVPLWDRARGKTITLRADRIKGAETAGSPPKGIRLPTLREWLRSQGRSEEGPSVRFVVELTARGVLACLDNESVQPYVKTEEDGSGLAVLEVPESALDHVAGYFFTLGPEARIREPEAAAGRVRELARRTLERYGE
ncbi:helix-turn-helix transcriptional regulator [Paenibacillus sp. CN-4]|uniref:helix-turn-helix transcriptional regulator n=1 Tax=Paenibacillus nanchangensis TaxID=3348343 RepID=UPI003978DF01